MVVLVVGCLVRPCAGLGGMGMEEQISWPKTAI